MHLICANLGHMETSECTDLSQPARRCRDQFLVANGSHKVWRDVEAKIKEIVAHAETDRVLGVHMIGPRVGELIVEAAMAMSCGASSEDIARVCHAHPTLHEVVKEAALAVDGRAIHM